MARVDLYYQGIGEAMRTHPVREALAKRAIRITGAAASMSSARTTVTTEHGTRPGGRPYSRTVSDAVDEEFGTEKTPRRRILWAAASGLYGSVYRH